MRAVRAALAAVLLLAAAPSAATEGEAIRAVIVRQLDAFARDDWEGAFAFASPAIRSLFATPERFGRMVRESYPMVWRPRRVEPGPLERDGGARVQIMEFEDAAGDRHLAAYEMVRVGGEWRINGVRIRRLPGAGV